MNAPARILPFFLPALGALAACGSSEEPSKDEESRTRAAPVADPEPIHASLRPPSPPEYSGGMALVAAKTFYFGVGGGMRAFCQEIEGGNGAMEDCLPWEDSFRLRAESVWDTSACGGVMREIVRVTFMPR